MYLLNRTIVRWREKNRHNYTIPANAQFPNNQVSVGNYTYGPLYVIPYRDDVFLKIGSCCSIAEDVVFHLGGEHHIDRISTFLFNRILLKQLGGDDYSKGDILIDDDVWIGRGVQILSGVHLSRGTVVAAGSVVCKSTEPYDVVGGCPAKLIKERFNQETINRLSDIDFEKINVPIVRDNGWIFNRSVTEFGDNEWDYLEKNLKHI